MRQGDRPLILRGTGDHPDHPDHLLVSPITVVATADDHRRHCCRHADIVASDMQDDTCTSAALMRGGYMTVSPGGQDQQQSNHIEPHELVAMFRRAAPRGACPTIAMLDACPFLRSTIWVRDMMASVPDWEPAEREAHRALRILSNTLPEILDAYRKLLGFHPFDHRRLAVLGRLYEMIPSASAALEPFHESPAWHAPAELIAMDAMKAWRLAGRPRIGCNKTSPLVNFVQAFLERANVHQEHGTIAMAFERGSIGRIAKQPTTAEPQL